MSIIDWLPCLGIPAPAIADIQKLFGALTIYAVDSILVGRICNWNYRFVYLASVESSSGHIFKPKAIYQLCITQSVTGLITHSVSGLITHSVSGLLKLNFNLTDF